MTLAAVGVTGCKGVKLFDDPIARSAWEPNYFTHVNRVTEYEERHGYSRETAERLANEDAFENYLRKEQRRNASFPDHP